MSERYPSILATRLGVEHNVTRIGVPTEERILKSGERAERFRGWGGISVLWRQKMAKNVSLLLSSA